MGWATGYLEFHEEAGFEPIDTSNDKPFKCKYCGESFKTKQERTRHYIAHHPLKTPVILIYGEEISPHKYVISENIGKNEIEILNTDSAVVNDDKLLAIDELREFLSYCDSGLYKIDLKNKYNNTTKYTIEKSVIDISELNYFEASLEKYFARNELNSESWTRFLQDKKFKTISNYVDGISDFVFGILSKDNKIITTLNFEDKLNQAASKLKNYKLRLAKLIVSVIQFNFNNFNALDYYKGSNLYKALNYLIGKEFPKEKFSLDYEIYFMDDVTRKIVELCLCPMQEYEYCISTFSKTCCKIYPRDQTKLDILSAKYFMNVGKIDECKKILTKLNNVEFNIDILKNYSNIL